MKHQNKKDKLDESLGMHKGKESTKKQSEKDRRDEAEKAKIAHKPMEKKKRK